MLEKREFEKNDFLWRLSLAVTVVSGLFSVVVFLLLLINFLQVESIDPIDNQLITKLRQEYAALPQKDVQLAERIRDLELLNRKAFFSSQYHLRTGALLLLVGVCIFMVAAKNAIRWKRAKPKLDEVPTHEQEFIAFAESRQLIMWAGVLLLGVGLGATLLTESALVNDSKTVASAAVKEDGAPDAKAAAEAFPAPKWEEMLTNWPSFRGPGSEGVAHFTNAPTEWDLAAGTNVKWKTELTLPGPNSPVIWGDKIFFSAATETQRMVYCYSAADGKLLWEQDAKGLEGTAPAAPPKVTEDTGFAAPTMVVHGGYACAIFADGALVCYDADGKMAWGKYLGVPSNHYGHASSLLAYDTFLYVQMDTKDNPRLIAFNIADGKEAWTAKREHISWASPTLAQTPDGPWLLLANETNVDAYDPMTGKLLWTQECLSGEVAPSPVYSNGTVFAANEYAIAAAIQAEKSGDTYTPKIIWEYDELLPEISSPTGDGTYFYFGTAGGILVCLEAATGKKMWEHEFDAGFNSSPVVVGDRLYIGDKDGTLHIVKTGPEFSIIASHDIGEPVLATPAFMDGKIYLRTNSHLYCIEQSNA